MKLIHTFKEAFGIGTDYIIRDGKSAYQALFRRTALYGALYTILLCSLSFAAMIFVSETVGSLVMGVGIMLFIILPIYITRVINEEWRVTTASDSLDR